MVVHEATTWDDYVTGAVIPEFVTGPIIYKFGRVLVLKERLKEIYGAQG